jgi:hypothetical protein
MAYDSPCDQCKQTGFPILFTRYAAAYSATKEGMNALETLEPTGNLKARPGGIALKTTKYNVRMLRAGYLYLRLETAIRTPEWLAFAVHPHGYLTKIDIKYAEKTTADAACKPNEWGANRSLVWIKDAENISKLQFMFHPDPVDHDHLTKVIGAAPDKYMQTINVAAWVKGTTGQDDTMLPDQLDARVLEFKALSGQTLKDVASEQVFGLMGCTTAERQWGDWEEEQISPPLTVDDYGRGDAVKKIVKHTQPQYDQAHGPRLRKMVEFLKANKGAVVACEDAIGIAQELSMHHLTAAVPYVRWLQEADAKGVSNQFKQAASESVSAIRQALQQGAMSKYDEGTENLRRSVENRTALYPGSDMPGTTRVRQADGSYKDMTIAELNKQRNAEDLKKAEERGRGRAQIDKNAAREAAESTQALCDNAAIAIFDTLHKKKIRDRDDLMDRIASDLHLWLKADALIERALGRYNENANPARSPDGLRCAGQLCAILMQVDSAPKGRAWHASHDTFQPGKKNLVWRMLSFNNATISSEMQVALVRVTEPLLPAGVTVNGAADNAKLQHTFSVMGEALESMIQARETAEKVLESVAQLNDPAATIWQRASLYFTIGKAFASDSLSILMAAGMEYMKTQPATRAEVHAAKCQAVAMSRGLGKSAVAILKNELADSLKGVDAKRARYLERRARKFLKAGGAAGAAKEARIDKAFAYVTAFAIVPALGKAYVKRDARSVSELTGALAMTMAAFKQHRVTIYKESLFAHASQIGGHSKSAAAMVKGTEAELLSLKAGAAAYVVAGTAVVVIWDAVDAVKAYSSDERLLSVAYIARAVANGGTIGAAITGAFFTEAPLWLTRINVYLMIATGVTTFAIGQIKGEAWVSWLLAQPFRASMVKDADADPLASKKKFVGLRTEEQLQQPRPNTKAPFKNEEQMMSKLQDALSEMSE